MDDTILQIPTFSRLADYLGLWLLESNAAFALERVAVQFDLLAHIDHASQHPEPLRSLTEKVGVSGGKQVAVIGLSGLLMKSQSSFGGTSTVQARKEIRAAVTDPDIGGILLRVESPGGTVAGTDALAQDVKAASRKKPVWAQVEDLAASAAVWAIAGAQRIFANSPTALYGSIGTYQVLYDSSAAEDKIGARTILVSTGSLKGMGVPGTKITDAMIAHVQGLVDEMQTAFDDAVRKGRDLSAKQLADVRHGGVMSARAAIDAGLIDGIQSTGKTLSELTAAIKSDGRARADFDTGAPTSVGSLPMIPRHGLPTLSQNGA